MADMSASRWPASFALALGLHAAVLFLLARQAIVELDVEPISIELAFLDAGVRTAAPGEIAPQMRLAAPPPAAPEKAEQRDAPIAAPAEADVETPAPPEPSAKLEPDPVAKPAPKPAAKPEKKPSVEPDTLANKPTGPPNVAGATAEGIGETSGPSTPGGTESRQTTTAWAPAARVRYEQELFAWMDRHKQYPMLAQRRRIEGNGSVRVRIDRSGRVLERAIATSTGEPMLDQAALEMVRRANPFPAVPPEYAGDSFEFVAPIQYRLR